MNLETESYFTWAMVMAVNLENSQLPVHDKISLMDFVNYFMILETDG
ncbi:unnamed protein product [Leptidea sinapis]|uniref:Uncharacterized protein n=1 Tax=Leptidea sinapis TaxID=189913 RepID=A0A5E4PYL1_9NEOP|nr:unnamed protein product [Leptidea sinapis]